jgi:hypothetical protein
MAAMTDSPELQDMCNLGLSPIIPDERKLRWTEYAGYDELEFEKAIIGKRRVRFFERQPELLVIAGSN